MIAIPIGKAILAVKRQNKEICSRGDDTKYAKRGGIILLWTCQLERR